MIPLPADLSKLRERFLAQYPEEAERVNVLARVPAALRHLLSLRLELDRADTLPRHHRNLALMTLRGSPRMRSADPVEQLVVSYAAAVKRGRHQDAIALVPSLHRYFTQPQMVELALTLNLAKAFMSFDALMELTSTPGQSAVEPSQAASRSGSAASR